MISDASKEPRALIHYWKKKYAPSIAVTLPVMTEKERQKLEAAQNRMKALEKQLEDAQMKNIALETMIDIAEQELRIDIRKSLGPNGRSAQAVLPALQCAVLLPAVRA